MCDCFCSFFCKYFLYLAIKKFTLKVEKFPKYRDEIGVIILIFDIKTEYMIVRKYLALRFEFRNIFCVGDDDSSIPEKWKRMLEIWSVKREEDIVIL